MARRGQSLQNRVVSAKHEPKKRIWAPIGLAQTSKLSLDGLDVALLRGLAQNPQVPPLLRKPAKLMANELGVDEATVRSRLKKWEATGFLVFWGATVSRALLGQRRCLLRFEVPDQSLKAAVLSKLRLVEGVHRIRDYHGGAVTVGIFFDSASTLDKRIKLVQALANVQDSLRVEIEEPPRPQTSLDETDMLILGTIGWSARKHHVSVARETGLSPKTVRRRLERMLETHAVEMGLFLDYRCLTGVIVADLLVVYSPEEGKDVNDRILSMAGDRMLPSSFITPGASGFRLMLTNVAEQREVMGAIRHLEGVKSAWLDLLVEDIFVAETYYAMEREMLERVSAKRPLSPRTNQVWEESWKISTDDVYPRSVRA